MNGSDENFFPSNFPNFLFLSSFTTSCSSFLRASSPQGRVIKSKLRLLVRGSEGYYEGKRERDVKREKMRGREIKRK